ncbi:MAG: CsbD family protein [Syntrophobacteraceae bacterium CG07_land_8_20_14_0_80_61_8]|nr:MAG: CsbD family protein [Syntrophobacteraceae bacterium CG07_land_8_20_14_0_80_61_8]
MKSSTKDKIVGEKDEIKGKVKEGLGKLTGNRDLEQEGKADQVKGAVQKKVGEIKQLLSQ